jgi:hypothetical protein
MSQLPPNGSSAVRQKSEVTMSQVLEVKTTVLPGHRIEIYVPDFPEGGVATVRIELEGASPSKRRLSAVLADYPGGQLFRSAEEVDAYLKAERASWDS